MSLDQIVKLEITVDSRAVSQASFGTPLLVGYHTRFADRVKEYAHQDDMLVDGFTTDDDLYKAAKTIKSQEPNPSTFKIGRRETALRQVIELTPLTTKEGFKYKGVVGGKNLTYTVGAGATLGSVAAGLLAAINALSAGTTATADLPASVKSSVAGPWSLEHAGTLLVAIDADVPGSPDTATFNATAAARETTNSESTPFNLDDGMILNVKVDGGEAQPITFATANFVDINAATAEEVAAVINGQITGAKATVTSGGTKVTITSDRKGTGSHIEVTGGTANAAGALNFATAEVDGTGNVADITAVTAAEAKTIIEAAVAGCTVSDEGGYLKIASNTTGASSKVLVTAASTLDDEFGLDNATHLGTDGNNVVTCTANSLGKVVDFDFSGLSNAQLGIKDVTVDTTTDDELVAINAEDTDWYGLVVIDSSSKATGLLAAGWIETVRKQQVFQTSDSEAVDSDEDEDIFSALVASSYSRTGGIYHRCIGGAEWLGVGWMAGMLALDPGSATGAFKEVKGVKVNTKLSTGEESALTAKNATSYTKTGGYNITYDGKSSSGEYMDTIRFIDFIFARMRESVMGAFASNRKVPFTDTGANIIRSAMQTVLDLGITTGGFASDPAPTITIPKVKDVPLADRKNRKMPNIKFGATLAGAVHLVEIAGLVTV